MQIWAVWPLASHFGPFDPDKKGSVKQRIEYSAGVVHVNREAWCMLSGKMVQSDRRHGAGRKD